MVLCKKGDDNTPFDGKDLERIRFRGGSKNYEDPNNRIRNTEMELKQSSNYSLSSVGFFSVRANGKMYTGLI